MSSSEFATTSAHQPLGKRDIHIQMQDTSPEAIQTLLEEVQFNWHETLGVTPMPMPTPFDTPRPRSPSPTTPRGAAPRDRWPASMPLMNRPADRNQQAEPPAQPAPCPALRTLVHSTAFARLTGRGQCSPQS